MNIIHPKSVQPIPDDAKKVFSGVLFDVYQWEQEQFDGSVKLFEKLKRANTVQIIPVTEDKKILILKEEQPGKLSFFTTPGGMMELNEEPLNSAKRELLEETGYTSDDYDFFNSVQPTSKIDWTIYTFIARKCKRIKDQELDSGEKIELQYLSFDEFIDILTDTSFRDGDIAFKILSLLSKKNNISKFKALLGL